MRICECPKCGKDISDTYEGYDPDVGIMGDSWYCSVCDYVVEDDGEPYDADDYGIGKD